jgi:hypothetical protein
LAEVARLTAGGRETAGLPLVELAAAPGGGHRLRVEFLRHRADSLPGIATAARFSADLAAWQDSGQEESVTPLDALWERVVVVEDTPAGSARRFACVVVTRTP